VFEKGSKNYSKSIYTIIKKDKNGYIVKNDKR